MFAHCTVALFKFMVKTWLDLLQLFVCPPHTIPPPGSQWMNCSMASCQTDSMPTHCLCWFEADEERAATPPDAKWLMMRGWVDKGYLERERGGGWERERETRFENRLIIVVVHKDVNIDDVVNKVNNQTEGTLDWGFFHYIIMSFNPSQKQRNCFCSHMTTNILSSWRENT